MKQFLLKLSTLLTLIFTSTGCASLFVKHPKLKPLNIGFYKNEAPLINKLVKEYKQKEILISNLSKADEAKIITSLTNGSLDIFIGNLNLPKEASNISSEIIAKDALVIVTSKNNPINNISKTQTPLTGLFVYLTKMHNSVE